MVELLDAFGRPLTRAAIAAARNGHATKREPTNERTGVFRAAGSAANSYLFTLGQTGSPAAMRARDPLRHHAWVAAGLHLVATVGQSAPLVVFRETTETMRARRELVERSGRTWSDRRFNRRTAVQRHLRGSLTSRLLDTSAVPDHDHELAVLLEHPNSAQDGAQLNALTDLCIGVYGEAHWLKYGKDGKRATPDALPAELWPIPPHFIRPRQEREGSGRQIGWWVRRPSYCPGPPSSTEEAWELWEVVCFKLPNPEDPLRGLSRLTAAAGAIETDMLARRFNRETLARAGVPKGVLKFEGELEPEEEAAFLKKWRDEFEAAENTNRIALLEGGWSFERLSEQGDDNLFLGLLDKDREEVLATLGVNGSVLGATEFTNYATALAQDKHFWLKSVQPLMALKERAIDRGLLGPLSDDVFAAFDVSGIEALRSGIEDQIKMADALVAERLHCPPRVAYSIAGLQVPPYPGDSVAFVSGLARPVANVLADEANAAASGGLDSVDDPEDGPEEPSADVDPGTEDEPKSSGPYIRTTRAKAKEKSKRWRAFRKLEEPLERKTRVVYRTWILREESDTLKRFDKAAKEAGVKSFGRFFGGVTRAPFDITVVVPDVKAAGSRLRTIIRPTYAGIIESTWDFTLDDIGVPTFAIDDERIVAFWQQREALFTQRAPSTVAKRLTRSLKLGIDAGETVTELRQRVEQVFAFQGGKSNALAVARTETAGLMDGTREQMFAATGFEKRDWTTAEDENVRDSHVVYGEAGPQASGFNYRTLIGAGGQLLFPHDPQAPAEEVVNCRCMHGPAD